MDLRELIFFEKNQPPEMVMDGHEFEGTNITPMSDWIWYKNYSWKIMVNSPVSGRFTGGTNPERFWM